MEPEIITAQISLERLLKSNFKVLKSDIAKSMKIDKTVGGMIDKLIDNKEVPMETPISLSKAREIIEDAKELHPEIRLQEMATELTPEMLDSIITLLNKLVEAVPETEGASEIARFAWKCRLIDNPFWILHLMGNRQMTPLDVAMLKEIYPAIHTVIIEQIVDTLVENMKDINKLPRPLKFMLSMLLEIPVLNEAAVKAYTISDNVKPTDLKVQ